MNPPLQLGGFPNISLSFVFCLFFNFIVLNGDFSPLRFTSHFLSFIVFNKRPKCECARSHGGRLSVTTVTERRSANAALLRLKITNNTLPFLNRLPPPRKPCPTPSPRPLFTHIPVKLMFLQPSSLRSSSDRIPPPAPAGLRQAGSRRPSRSERHLQARGGT